MKPYKSFFLLLVFGYMITTAQTHPFLFFNSTDITNIRSRATTINPASPTPANQLWNLILISQADYYKGSSTINRLASSEAINPGSMDLEYFNLYSLALAYVIKTPQDPSYLTAVRTVLWGGPSVPTGMLAQLYTDNNSAWHWASRPLTLSLVYDLLYSSFTVAERESLKTVIHNDVYNRLRPWVRDDWTSKHQNNHFAASASALGIIAICFNGDNSTYADAGSDLTFVKNHLLTSADSYLNRYFSDGASTEGILYGLWGINNLLPFIKILSRWEGTDYFHDPRIQPNMQKISTWLSYELFPGNRTSHYYNKINDSDNMEVGNLTSFFSNLLVFSQCYQDGVAKWLFDNTVVNISNLINFTDDQRWVITPSLFLAFLSYDNYDVVVNNSGITSATNPGTVLPRARLFDRRGLAYIRTSTSSDWADNNDIQFGFEAHQVLDPVTGFHSVVHNHEDKNHFLLNAFGEEFIIDPGYRNRDFTPNNYKADQHNYILIDNVGEARNPDEEGGSPWSLMGATSLSMVNSDNCSFIYGNATGAFNNLYASDASQSSGYSLLTDATNSQYGRFLHPVINAERYVLFSQSEGSGLPPAYILIADDIRKENNNNSHNYKWLFNSYKLATQSTNTSPVLLQSGSKGLELWYTADASTITVDKATTMDATNGAYHNALSVNAINPYFHVILFPYQSSTQQPNINTRATQNGSCFKIAWTGYNDYSLFRHSTGTVSSQGLSSNAKLVQFRQSTSGQITSFNMCKGTNLVFGTTLLAETYDVVATVLVSGQKVVIDGQGVQNFNIYAPNATSVVINGVQTSFVRSGNYVVSPTTPVLIMNSLSISFGNVTVNTTSSEQTYTITGTNLTPSSGNITVAAPLGYQVSATSGSGFASSIAIAYSGGSLASKIVYVRFAPTAIQNYTGDITNSGGGATTVNVTVSGNGIPPPPTILCERGPDFEYQAGSTSITISNSGGGTLNWSASSNVSWMRVRPPNSGTNNGTITIEYDENTTDSPRSGTITVTGTGATNSPQTMTYVQRAPPPIVSMSVNPLSGTQVGSTDVTIYYYVNQLASINIYVDWVWRCGDYLSGSGQCTVTLSAGSHTIYVDAGNRNGSNSVSETYIVQYPPTPSISNLSYYPTGNNNYTLMFSVAPANQYFSNDISVKAYYCDTWSGMGGNFSGNISLAPGNTNQIKVRSTNNYGMYSEAYLGIASHMPPTVYISGVSQVSTNVYTVDLYVESGSESVNISLNDDGSQIYGWQNTGGSVSYSMYLESGMTHEICATVGNVYGNDEACTSIDVQSQHTAPTISQISVSRASGGSSMISFYVDSDNQPVTTYLYTSYCESWQNNGGYMSGGEVWYGDIVTIVASNQYGSSSEQFTNYNSYSMSDPLDIAGTGPVLLKKNGISSTSSNNGNGGNKNTDILSSTSATFNNAASTLSGGSGIAVTSNKKLARKKNINVLSSNVKRQVASNKIGTYTILSKSIEHTWDIKSNSDKKAFIFIECPSVEIRSGKGNPKAVKFKNDNQDKNHGNKTASFDMDLSKNDTISAPFKISYSHLNALRIDMNKGIEFKVIVDAHESNGKNKDAYQMTIKEPLSNQTTDSLGMTRLDKVIKWVVPKNMKSITIVPRITENIIDSTLKVNIVYEIISSQDSINKNQASIEKGEQVSQEAEVKIPTNFEVSQNCPNPFNPSTVIRYQLPAASFVKLVVYDVMGREVSILAEGIKNTGYYTSTFDGSRFASGIYFARLTAIPQYGNRPFVKVMKMLMVK